MSLWRSFDIKTFGKESIEQSVCILFCSICDEVSTMFLLIDVIACTVDAGSTCNARLSYPYFCDTDTRVNTSTSSFFAVPEGVYLISLLQVQRLLFFA